MPSWGELLNELQPHKNENGEDVQGLTVDELREKYLKLLSQQTGRNVIAYYSGWLKPGKTQNIDINDSDITGVMNAIKGLDCDKGLDLILRLEEILRQQRELSNICIANLETIFE